MRANSDDTLLTRVIARNLQLAEQVRQLQAENTRLKRSANPRKPAKPGSKVKR